MDLQSLKYYKVIGKIQSTISNSETFYDAIKSGLKIILENTNADSAVIWMYNKKTKKLYPYYWISPTDFTTVSYDVNEGIPGQVYNTSKHILINDHEKLSNEEELKINSDYNISSLLCVPMGSEYNCHGVIEIFKSKDNEVFSDEEVDICQILTMMADIAITEKQDFQDELYEGNIILSAKNIKKTFINGDIKTNVLKGVNLDVIEGELMVILGESGCGKSTFLNIISGLEKADEGNITFMDKDLTNATEEELTKYRRDNIGFVFQSYNLMPNLNAKQNLDLIGELVDNPMDSDEALKLVGLYDRKDNYPSELSGGQQQRVSIARAIIKNPKLIFADEPTAALDYLTSIEVLSVIEDIVKKGTTVLMVTHNEEITKMANRVIRMRDGKTYEVSVNHFPLSASELVW